MEEHPLSENNAFNLFDWIWWTFSRCVFFSLSNKPIASSSTTSSVSNCVALYSSHYIVQLVYNETIRCSHSVNQLSMTWTLFRILFRFFPSWFSLHLPFKSFWKKPKSVHLRWNFRHVELSNISENQFLSKMNPTNFRWLKSLQLNAYCLWILLLPWNAIDL